LKTWGALSWCYLALYDCLLSTCQRKDICVDEEVKKSNYFLEQFQRIEGSKVLSEWPRKHTLTKVDTTGSFDVVAKHTNVEASSLAMN